MFILFLFTDVVYTAGQAGGTLEELGVHCRRAFHKKQKRVKFREIIDGVMA